MGPAFLQARDDDDRGSGGGRAPPAADARAPTAAHPSGKGGGSAESMTAAFGHLADPAAQAEAEAALAECQAGIRARLKASLAAQTGPSGRSPGSPAEIDTAALTKAAESIAATDVRRIRARFAGRVPDEEFARMAGRYRDAARNEAAQLQIDVFEGMGAELELDSEGKRETPDKRKYVPPPRV